MDIVPKELAVQMAREGTFFVSEISSDSVEALCRQILEYSGADNKSVTIVFNSKGGNSWVPRLFDDFTRGYRGIPITGIAVMECSSAAFGMLQSCDKRKATYNCRFKAHSYRSTPSIPFNGTEEEQILIIMKDAHLHNERLIELMLEKSSLTRAGWLEMARKGDECNVYLTAQDALEHGLIDEVLESFDPFK